MTSRKTLRVGGFLAAFCFAACAFGAMRLPEGAAPPAPPPDAAESNTATAPSPAEIQPVVQNVPAPIPVQEAPAAAETPPDPLTGMIKVVGFLAFVLAGTYFWFRSKKPKA